MEIKNRKALVLGGPGLVGRAVCRLLIEEGVSELVISSLFQHENDDFIAELEKEYDLSKIKISTYHGNLFVRTQLKELSRNQILNDPENRKVFVQDIIQNLNSDILQNSSLYQLITQTKADLVVDSVNTATAVAYQDIFTSTSQVHDLLTQAKSGDGSQNELFDAVEKLLGTQYIPQLIRHVQIMLQSLKDGKCSMYIKVGTSGTGGMGLNIPYTHSEDKPSRVLLAKSAIGGAHTLLLFLMGRTPDAPIIKEVKPTAAIAWKKIGYGPISVKGKQLILEDCSIEDAFELSGTLDKVIKRSEKIQVMTENGKPKPLSAPFVDTGENGMFSLGEFEAITDAGQMEFITPEEIAQSIIWEIKGRNTGTDIVNALDNATMGPTYRAGFMRRRVIDTMKQLEKEHQVDSVAFEMLGPPRLSKLLYEVYLLKNCFQSFSNISNQTATSLSEKVTDFIQHNQLIRSRILSIGIPILLPDGKRILRGSEIKIPTNLADAQITPEHINQWAYDGWVDLRESSMLEWLNRIKTIRAEIGELSDNDTSSRVTRNKDYWFGESGISSDEIHIGKVASWIFIREEKGERMKA